MQWSLNAVTLHSDKKLYYTYWSMASQLVLGHLLQNHNCFSQWAARLSYPLGLGAHNHYPHPNTNFGHLPTILDKRFTDVSCQFVRV